MAIQTITASPPHPVPPKVRDKAHKFLDEVLDRYEWNQSKSNPQFLLWDYSTSMGVVRISVAPDNE